MSGNNLLETQSGALNLISSDIKNSVPPIDTKLVTSVAVSVGMLLILAGLSTGIVESSSSPCLDSTGCC